MRIECVECSVVGGEVIRDFCQEDVYFLNPATFTRSNRAWCRGCYEKLVNRALRPQPEVRPTLDAGEGSCQFQNHSRRPLAHQPVVAARREAA